MLARRGSKKTRKAAKVRACLISFRLVSKEEADGLGQQFILAGSGSKHATYFYVRVVESARAPVAKNAPDYFQLIPYTIQHLFEEHSGRVLREELVEYMRLYTEANEISDERPRKSQRTTNGSTGNIVVMRPIDLAETQFLVAPKPSYFSAIEAGQRRRKVIKRPNSPALHTLGPTHEFLPAFAWANNSCAPDSFLTPIYVDFTAHTGNVRWNEGFRSTFGDVLADAFGGPVDADGRLLSMTNKLAKATLYNALLAGHTTIQFGKYMSIHEAIVHLSRGSGKAHFTSFGFRHESCCISQRCSAYGKHLNPKSFMFTGGRLIIYLFARYPHPEKLIQGEYKATVNPTLNPGAKQSRSRKRCKSGESASTENFVRIHTSEFNSIQEAIEYEVSTIGKAQPRCTTCDGPVRAHKNPLWFPDGYLFVEIAQQYEGGTTDTPLKLDSPPFQINRRVTMSSERLGVAEYTLLAVIYRCGAHYVSQVSYQDKIFYYDGMPQSVQQRERRILVNETEAFLDRYGNYADAGSNQMANAVIYKRA